MVLGYGMCSINNSYCGYSCWQKAKITHCFSRNTNKRFEFWVCFFHFWVQWILVTLSSVQSLSWVWLFATPWTAVYQASMSIMNSWSLLKLMSVEWVMPSNHLILCRPLIFPHSIFTSIRVFSNESALQIRWPKYWSFSFSISPSSEYSGLISFRMDKYFLLCLFVGNFFFLIFLPVLLTLSF